MVRVGSGGSEIVGSLLVPTCYVIKQAFLGIF